MRFFNGLFSSKKNKQAGNNLQNWGRDAQTTSNNGTSVLLEYPSSDDDSSVELSSSSSEDESHQLPYLPSKHGSHRRARCPPFGAKSIMGFRQSQEDAWSHMPEVAWLSVRSTRQQSQATKLIQSLGRTDLGEGAPETPDTSNHTTSPPPLRHSVSSKRLSSSGVATQQPPALTRTLTSKGLLRPILQGGLASLKAAPAPFEPVPGLQGHHPVHFFAVFDGHGGSAVAKHCSKRLHKNLKEVFELAWTEAIAESAKSKERHQLHSQLQAMERVHPGLQHQLSQSRHQAQLQQQQQGLFATRDTGASQELQATAESVSPLLEQPEQVMPVTGGASSPSPLHDCKPCAAAHKSTALKGESPDFENEGDAGAAAVLPESKKEADAGAVDAVAVAGATNNSAVPPSATDARHKQGAAAAAAAMAPRNSMSSSSTADGMNGAQLAPDFHKTGGDDKGASCSTYTATHAVGGSPEVSGEQKIAEASVPAVDNAAGTSSGSGEMVGGGAGPGARPVAEADCVTERNSAAAAGRNSGKGGECHSRGSAPGARPVAETDRVAERNSAAAAAAGMSSDPTVPPVELPHAPLVVDVSRPSSHAPDSFGHQDYHHPDSSKSGPSVWPAELSPGHPSPAAPTTFKPDVSVCLAQAFVRTDQEVFQAKISRETGCTAVVLLTSEDNIWLANCGDSRAILCRASETVCLSDDHKASRPDEVARIEAAGGYVWWDRVMGELAVSRAIGDHCFSPFVISEPEVVCMRRAFSDQLIILATDGMWDVFTNEEAHEAAWARFQKELGKGRSSQEAAKRTATWLVDKSIDRGTRDNVTVLVVDVRMPNKGSRKGPSGAQARGSEQYQRGGTGGLGEDGELAAEGAEVDTLFHGVQATQGQSEQETHVAAGGASGNGQSNERQSGGKSKGGRKQKDGGGGIGKGCAKKQDAGRVETANGEVPEGEQKLNSLSTNSLPRRGFSSAANMNHFSVDEPPSRSHGTQQSSSKLKNASNGQEPVVSEASPPSAPPKRCLGCFCSR